MANSYIVLDGKQYPVAMTRYQPTEEKIQNVQVTVGGHHVSQHFDFVEYRWGFDLRVPYTGDATWGDVEDLKTAYRLEYCAFIDHYGNIYDVFIEGPLQERSRQPPDRRRGPVHDFGQPAEGTMRTIDPALAAEMASGHFAPVTRVCAQPHLPNWNFETSTEQSLPDNLMGHDCVHDNGYFYRVRSGGLTTSTDGNIYFAKIADTADPSDWEAPWTQRLR